MARCEIYEYSLSRDEQRALIASWRERAAENRRLREAIEEALEFIDREAVDDRLGNRIRAALKEQP